MNRNMASRVYKKDSHVAQEANCIVKIACMCVGKTLRLWKWEIKRIIVVLLMVMMIQGITMCKLMIIRKDRDL